MLEIVLLPMDFYRSPPEKFIYENGALNLGK
jgi:hypothetical protein